MSRLLKEQGLCAILLVSSTVRQNGYTSLRRKLLKIGAVVRVTVRKVWIAFSEGCPYQELFAHAHQQFVGLAPLPRASPG